METHATFHGKGTEPWCFYFKSETDEYWINKRNSMLFFLVDETVEIDGVVR